jgi:branched-chain amino acid transport system substrate-binding protein
MGIKVPIIGSEGLDSPKFIELAGDAAEGAIFASDLDRDSESPVVKSFLDKYKMRWGIDADMCGASAYDAVRVLCYAIENGGTTPEGMKNALVGLKDLEGVTGVLKYFSEQGNICKPVTLQVVKESAFHRYCIIEEPEIIKPPL